MAPLLSLSQVSKNYPDGRHQIEVFDRISLEIDPGDYIGVWGPRSSGKSTLLRIMAGIEQPDRGGVCFDGHLLSELSAAGRARLLRNGGIALAVSDWRPQINRPAVDLVAMAYMGDGTTLADARRHSRRALHRVRAEQCADLPVGRLSLAERMRIALACALVREPRLLLVDEPAVLPNLLEAEELYAVLRSLGRGGELAIVVASEEITSIHGTDRTVAVSDGQLRTMDTTAVVLPFPVNASNDPRQ